MSSGYFFKLLHTNKSYIYISHLSIFTSSFLIFSSFSHYFSFSFYFYMFFASSIDFSPHQIFPLSLSLSSLYFSHLSLLSPFSSPTFSFSLSLLSTLLLSLLSTFSLTFSTPSPSLFYVTHQFPYNFISLCGCFLVK